MTFDELLDLNNLHPDQVAAIPPQELIAILSPHLAVCQPTSPVAGTGGQINTTEFLAGAKAKKAPTQTSMQETLRQLAEMKAKLLNEGGNKP